MAALKPITAAALVAMLAFPAHADVSGPVCVPDHQDTVYHPSMSAFTWFTAALEASLDAEALVNLMRRRWREIEQEPPRRTGT